MQRDPEKQQQQQSCPDVSAKVLERLAKLVGEKVLDDSGNFGAAVSPVALAALTIISEALANTDVLPIAWHVMTAALVSRRSQRNIISTRFYEVLTVRMRLFDKHIQAVGHVTGKKATLCNRAKLNP